VHRAKVYCMVLGVVDTIEDMCTRLGRMLEADDLTGLAACSTVGWGGCRSSCLQPSFLVVQ